MPPFCSPSSSERRLVDAEAEAEHQLNAQATLWKSQGYTVSWTSMNVDGWPFRMHLTLTALMRPTSGWALATPSLEAMSLPYAPDRWVIVAPKA